MSEGARLVLFVAVFGALGALSRLAVSHLCKSIALLSTTPIPLATLVVNVLGSFVYGWVFVFAVKYQRLPTPLCQAVLVGYLGALTTFSTYAFETSTLAQSHLGMASFNVAIHLVLGLAACELGIFLAGGRL